MKNLLSWLFVFVCVHAPIMGEEKSSRGFDRALGLVFSCTPVEWRVTGQPPMLHDRNAFFESFVIGGYPPGTKVTKFAFVHTPGRSEALSVVFYDGSLDAKPLSLDSWFEVETKKGELILKRKAKGGGEGGMWRAIETATFTEIQAHGGSSLSAVFEGTVVNTQLFVIRSRSSWRVEAVFVPTR